MTPPAPPPGFTGVRSRVLAHAQDGAHHVTLAIYTFDDPGHAPVEVPYVEMGETHDSARPGRVMALSALVHLAQNASDDEVWAIGGRDTPGPPAPDLTAQLDEARATIARLNRRAQRAEAIADRCAAGRPVSGPGLGRALANYAASRLAAIAREAVEGWAAAARCESGCQHGHECAPSAELVAHLDALTGAGRATLPAMASPTDPPPTRSPAAMLRDLETAAQELMRLHPATPHAPSVLALLTLARVEVGPDPGEPPPRT